MMNITFSTYIKQLTLLLIMYYVTQHNIFIRRQPNAVYVSHNCSQTHSHMEFKVRVGFLNSVSADI